MIRTDRSNQTGIRLVIIEFLLRHWVLSGFVMVFIVIGRFFTGRDVIGGGRKTDATFFRRARLERGSWWSSLPGIARAGIRLALLATLWFWALGYGDAVAIVAILTLIGLAILGYRRLQHRRYVRQVLADVWPAIAGIIGVADTDPPDAWLYIPARLSHRIADQTGHLPRLKAVLGRYLVNHSETLVIGLRAADAEDERRVADLVRLFDQRFGLAHAGTVDYQRRLVLLRLRPDEHDEWPAVASILGISPANLASDWMTYVHDTGNADPNTDAPVLIEVHPTADTECATTTTTHLSADTEPDDEDDNAADTETDTGELDRRRDEMASDDARILVTLPDNTTDDAVKADALAKLFRDRLGSGPWQPTIDHAARAVLLKHTTRPPKHVAFADYTGHHQLRDTQLYLGRYYTGRNMIADFEAMESPSTAVVGGAGSGKTTFLASQIAQTASRGAICLVLDPKFKFRPIFGNDIPNVLIFDDVREMRTASVPEWEKVLLFAERVMEDRLDENNIPAEQLAVMNPADIPDLSDRTRFPTVYLFIDEGGPFRLLTDENWRNRRDLDDDDPGYESGSIPRIVNTELTLVMRGREGRVFLVKAMHQANAKNFPEGTEGRQLYGNRITLGTDVEQQSWQMVAGTGRTRPNVPSHTGAGVHLKGSTMKQFQAAEIKAKYNPETRTNDARELAKQGIPLLDERGLLNESGRLVLPGYGELLPAILGTTVPDTATSHVPALAALPGGADPGGADPAAAAESEPSLPAAPTQPEPIRGLKAAAEYAGYGDYADPVAAFRKARERHPIPGEFDDNGRPAFDEFELREWAKQQRVYRKSRQNQGTEGRSA